MNTRTDIISDFDKKRTIITDTSKHKFDKILLYKNIIGLIIYIIVFVVVIPYCLIINNHYITALLYFSNVDMIATVLGFKGGPFNIWKYLYNPASLTLYGTLSSMLINYIALCGVGITILSYTLHHNNLYRGLSKFLIVILITYLLPGHFIVYFMNTIASMFKNTQININIIWIFVYICGLLLVTFIIIIEQYITEFITPFIIDIIKLIYMLTNKTK